MNHTTSSRRTVAVLGAVLLLAATAGCGSSNSSSAATTTTSTTAAGGGANRTTVDGGGSAGGTDSGVSTSSGGGADGATATTAPDGSNGSKGSTTTRAPDPYDGPGGGGPCVANPDRLSGTSTVIWTADDASKHKDSDATAATTMLFQKDGSLSPSTLQVKVGEVFTFGLADDISDIVSAKVGCDGGQTVLSGKPLAAEYITTPGTYDVVNVVADKQVGTITVK